MKAVCLRQSDEREGRGRRARDRARAGDADRRRPGSAGADEGLRHPARPPRQRQERARRDGRRRAGRRPADRRGDEDGRPRRARRRSRGCIPAIAAAAIEVGTPQIRNQGTVGGNLNQRPRCWYFRNEEFVCFKKGGNRCFSLAGENQFHAIFGGGPSFIVHPSSLAVPMLAYGATFRLARSEGRADGAGGGLLHAADAAERANGERARAETSS